MSSMSVKLIKLEPIVFCVCYSILAVVAMLKCNGSKCTSAYYFLIVSLKCI